MSYKSSTPPPFLSAHYEKPIIEVIRYTFANIQVTDVVKENQKAPTRKPVGASYIGAGYQIRTGDLQLGKLTLYH